MPRSFRTILLSVISLLNEPNTFSPANVDASVMYRKWRDSKGKDREYIEIIRYHEKGSHTLVTLIMYQVPRVPALTVSVLTPHSPSHALSHDRKQVLATKADADRDGVKVPVTLDEYCVRTQVPPTDDGSNLLYDDYYDDEELEDDDDDEDENEDCCYDEDDSGTEDSWPPPLWSFHHTSPSFHTFSLAVDWIWIPRPPSYSVPPQTVIILT